MSRANLSEVFRKVSLIFSLTVTILWSLQPTYRLDTIREKLLIGNLISTMGGCIDGIAKVTVK